MPELPTGDTHSENEDFAAEFAKLKPRRIVMSKEEYEWFIAQIEAPPRPNPRLVRSLSTKAPWEK